MALAISENAQSRSFTLGRQVVWELQYDLYGDEDEGNVVALLQATAPAIFQGVFRDSINADPLGGGVWKGYARYTTLENNDEYTFDTTGGTIHRTQSLATINSYAASGFVAPDYEGAINVTDDAIEGVDLPGRSFAFTETHQFTDVQMSDAYRLILFALTGTVNNGAFRIFAAGECLFLGVTGSKRGDELWSLTFHFLGEPNVTGLTVGGITGIDKLGHDYLWTRYMTFVDTSSFMLAPRPVVAKVERVFQFTDFSTLGIGT